MVDKGVQYEPPECPEPEPVKVPVMNPKSSDDQLNVSFLSDTTMSMEDDDENIGYLSDVYMEDLDQR